MAHLPKAEQVNGYKLHAPKGQLQDTLMSARMIQWQQGDKWWMSRRHAPFCLLFISITCLHAEITHTLTQYLRCVEFLLGESVKDTEMIPHAWLGYFHRWNIYWIFSCWCLPQKLWTILISLYFLVMITHCMVLAKGCGIFYQILLITLKYMKYELLS